MPADVKAKYYQWFMDEDHNQRVVGIQWWPEGEFTSSMTFGKVSVIARGEPGGAWGPPVEVGKLPWVVAQSYARGQGFHVEVAVHE